MSILSSRPATVPIQMLSTETGEFLAAVAEDSVGIWTYTGNLSVAGDVVTGTEYSAFIHPNSCDYRICFSGGTTTTSGTVSQRSSISLNGISWTYNDLHNQPSSLAAIAGNWTGNLSGTGGGDGILNISSTGAVHEQDASSSCVITVLEMMVTSKNPSGDVLAIALYQETAY